MLHYTTLYYTKAEPMLPTSPRCSFSCLIRFYLSCTGNNTRHLLLRALQEASRALELNPGTSDNLLCAANCLHQAS